MGFGGLENSFIQFVGITLKYDRFIGFKNSQAFSKKNSDPMIFKIPCIHLLVTPERISSHFLINAICAWLIIWIILEEYHIPMIEVLEFTNYNN